MLTDYILTSAAQLAKRTPFAPARQQQAIAMLLDQAHELLDSGDKCPTPYVCRACQREHAVEAFDTLGELAAHARTLHAPAWGDQLWRGCATAAKRHANVIRSIRRRLQLVADVADAMRGEAA